MENDLTPQDWETVRRVLKAVLRDPTLADPQPEFRTLVAGVNRLGRKHARQQQVLGLPPPVVGRNLRPCYICKVKYDRPYPSHASLCLSCGESNFARRSLRADLSGRVAVLTGGRVKIGYETSLKLLRDGARVIVTTRFPQDAARRYAREPDVADWQARLSLYGLDLRDLRGVQGLIDHLRATETHLDILINNAAQTISRPPEFYAHLLQGERQSAPTLPAAAGPQVLHPAQLTMVEDDTRYAALNHHFSPGELDPYFPPGELDTDGQQLDLRPANSWSALLSEVGTREMLEVQLVNASAPFMLCSGLRGLLLASPFERRFIVNVSAMEGQFARRSKTDRHPHTNMAKAALNMLTRTSGSDLAKSGIYMTSVDTGWVTNENPHPKAERMSGLGFVPPLDVTDGASRIYHPIVSGLTQEDRPLFGVFLKDYRPYAW